MAATSASKAWNLSGLKCADVILTSEPDRQHWEDMGPFASHGASNPGVVARIAALRHGEAWLDNVLLFLEVNKDRYRDDDRDARAGTRRGRRQRPRRFRALGARSEWSTGVRAGGFSGAAVRDCPALTE